VLSCIFDYVTALNMSARDALAQAETLLILPTNTGVLATLIHIALHISHLLFCLDHICDTSSQPLAIAQSLAWTSATNRNATMSIVSQTLQGAVLSITSNVLAQAISSYKDSVRAVAQSSMSWRM